MQWLSLVQMFMVMFVTLNTCRLATEGEFVSLMREHRALARVDLRRNTGKGGNKMGILKVRREESMDI
jgi:hypothetical protein